MNTQVPVPPTEPCQACEKCGGAAMLRLPAIALTCVLVSSLRNLPLALLLLRLLRLLWMLLLHTSLARSRVGQADDDGGEGDQCSIQAAGREKFGSLHSLYRPSCSLAPDCCLPAPARAPSSVFSVRTAC